MAKSPEVGTRVMVEHAREGNGEAFIGTVHGVDDDVVITVREADGSLADWFPSEVHELGGSR